MATSVAVGTYCLTYKRGDSFQSRFNIVEADGATAQDITGWSYILTVNTEKNPADTTNQQFQVTGVIEDAPGGVVGFSPTAVNTDITPGKYWYDIQQTDGAGGIRTIVKDRFIIEQDITKS